MTSEGTKTLILISEHYLENGAICKAFQTQNILILIFLSERGYIKAFYRLNFRLQTERTKQIGKFAFFFIDF